MKRSATKSALIPGLAICLGCLSSAAFAQSTCSIDYRVANEWGSGATHEIAVTYNGPPTNGWQLTWDFLGSEQITNLWNGSYSQSGQSVAVDSFSWNAQLNEGTTFNVGFNLNSPSGQIPTVFLNGIDCNGEATTSPDPAPEPDPQPEPTPDPGVAWTLDGSASFLNFVSAKNIDVVESHRFDVLTGEILDDGTATLVIDLNSVNTGIDIRNERMRNMLFETGTFPNATVSLNVDMNAVSALPEGERTSMTVSATLDLHGLANTITTDLFVQRLSSSRIMVQNVSPLLVSAADYSLEAGVEALREVAGLNVIGTTVPVDFTLFFDTPQI